MKKYDVAVIGGGFAGVAAALSAARQGAEVIIVEKANCLGGAAAENLYRAGKQGAYISRDEVGVRAEVSKGIIEILTNCGAMDNLPDSAQISLFE